MVDTGYQSQKYVLFPEGITDKVERNVEAAFYPGRLVIKGTTDYDAKPADSLKPPFGYAEFETASGKYQPLNTTTAYAVGAVVPIANAMGKPVFMPSGVPIGFYVEEGDLLVPWGAAGQVAPAAQIGKDLAIKIPFTKKTSEFDTGIDLPAGIIVRDCKVNATTAAGGATIDIGILSSESGGDADGLLDGESIASTGWATHNLVDATSGNITLGVLLTEAKILDATAVTPNYAAIPKGLVTDGTAKSITYTTSNHTVAGYFYLAVESPGIFPIGKAAYTVDATAAAADITVKGSLL